MIVADLPHKFLFNVISTNASCLVAKMVLVYVYRSLATGLSCLRPSVSKIMWHHNQLSELHIRGGIDDNSKIIFLISHRQHML